MLQSTVVGEPDVGGSSYGPRALVSVARESERDAEADEEEEEQENEHRQTDECVGKAFRNAVCCVERETERPAQIVIVDLQKDATYDCTGLYSA